MVKFVQVFMLMALLTGLVPAGRAQEQPPAVDPVAEAKKTVDAAKEAKEKAETELEQNTEALQKAKDDLANNIAKTTATEREVDALKLVVKTAEDLVDLAETGRKAAIAGSIKNPDKTAVEKAEAKLKDEQEKLRQAKEALAAKEKEASDLKEAFPGLNKVVAELSTAAIGLRVRAKKGAEDLKTAEETLQSERFKALTEELKKLKDTKSAGGLTDKEVEAILAKKLEGFKSGGLTKDEFDKALAAELKKFKDANLPSGGVSKEDIKSLLKEGLAEAFKERDKAEAEFRKETREAIRDLKKATEDLPALREKIDLTARQLEDLRRYGSTKVEAPAQTKPATPTPAPQPAVTLPSERWSACDRGPQWHVDGVTLYFKSTAVSHSGMLLYKYTSR